MLFVLVILFAECVALWALATLAFDVIHYLLHRASGSRWKVLRALGGLHESHHLWWDQNLEFHDELWFKSFVLHRIPEYLIQMVILLSFLFFASPLAVACVGIFSTVLLVGVLWMKGKDLGHIVLDPLPIPTNLFFVNLVYHSYHHRFPESYMGSFLTLLDKLLGTGTQLKGRSVALTGASGALGGALAHRLKSEGVAEIVPLKFGVDYSYTDYAQLDAMLAKCDLLILAHGSNRKMLSKANCDSFVDLIERYRQLQAHRKFAPEVWAVGSEIECHPSWGNKKLLCYSRSKRAFAEHAWRYYWDRSLLYRHIVPSAFTSRMGPGLMSAETAAWVSLGLIKRGFRYIPVTYTGIAFLNYFNFLKNRPKRTREL